MYNLQFFAVITPEQDAVYGVGTTAAAALDQAIEEAGASDEYMVYPCSAAVAGKAVEHGGDCVAWEILDDFPGCPEKYMVSDVEVAVMRHGCDSDRTRDPDRVAATKRRKQGP